MSALPLFGCVALQAGPFGLNKTRFHKVGKDYYRGTKDFRWDDIILNHMMRKMFYFQFYFNPD